MRTSRIIRFITLFYELILMYLFTLARIMVNSPIHICSHITEIEVMPIENRGKRGRSGSLVLSR